MPRSLNTERVMVVATHTNTTKMRKVKSVMAEAWVGGLPLSNAQILPAPVPEEAQFAALPYGLHRGGSGGAEVSVYRVRSLGGGSFSVSPEGGGWVAVLLLLLLVASPFLFLNWLFFERPANEREKKKEDRQYQAEVRAAEENGSPFDHILNDTGLGGRLDVGVADDLCDKHETVTVAGQNFTYATRLVGEGCTDAMVYRGGTLEHSIETPGSVLSMGVQASESPNAAYCTGVDDGCYGVLVVSKDGLVKEYARTDVCPGTANQSEMSLEIGPTMTFATISCWSAPDPDAGRFNAYRSSRFKLHMSDGSLTPLVWSEEKGTFVLPGA